MTTRISIYEWTDRAYIRELADDPTLELDISAIVTPQVQTATFHQPLLPAHIRVGLYMESAQVVLPHMVSCGDITAPNATGIFTHLLETAGNLDMPKLQFFSQDKLVRSGDILVGNASSFYAPLLERADGIDVHSAQSFYAPELRQVTRIQGDNLISCKAPHVPEPVDSAGRTVASFPRNVTRVYLPR
jgi:hypothetical protein